MRQAVIALLTLAFCTALIAAPVTETTETTDVPVVTQDAEAVTQEVATPTLLEAKIAACEAAFSVSGSLFAAPVPMAWSGCVEPSPCNTHADCAYPAGVCLPDLANPGEKSCACLPDRF